MYVLARGIAVWQVSMPRADQTTLEPLQMPQSPAPRPVSMTCA